MARFCPVTGDPVLYPDCQECEWKRQCRQGFPGGLPADRDTKNNTADGRYQDKENMYEN